MTETTLDNWKDAKVGDRYELSRPAFFTLKRADGIEKEVRFNEDEPGWILIKGTGVSNRQNVPSQDEHDYFDFNQRSVEAWNKRMWVWLNRQMIDFSDGKFVRAFYINPYVSIGGYWPNRR